MKVAAVLVALVVLSGCGGELSTDRPAAPEREPGAETVLGLVWRGEVGDLRRLDARTLRPVGADALRGLRPGTPAFSPDGRTVVLGSGEAPPVLRFVDVGSLRALGQPLELPARGWVQSPAWSGAERVVVFVGGSEPTVAVVGARTRRLLRAERLSGTPVAVDARRGRLVVLLAPRNRIGAARLAVADARGAVRTVALPGVRAGTEPIDDPADAAAARTSSPGVAVSPDGRRALVVPAGNRVVEVELDSLRVTPHELSEPVSLLGRLREWLDPAAQAKVLEGPTRYAAWLGESHVAITGIDQHGIENGAWKATAVGLRLIDTRDWSVRRVARDVTSLLRAGELVLAFGGGWPEGAKGAGLRAFGPDGEERFHVLGDGRLGWLEVAWPYAYVAQSGGQGRTREVVDLRHGRVVGRAAPPQLVTVLGR